MLFNYVNEIYFALVHIGSQETNYQMHSFSAKLFWMFLILQDPEFRVVTFIWMNLHNYLYFELIPMIWVG